MATQYKTPGVYIQEPNSFPPSIVGVDTAVPCFVGYTQFAQDGDGRDILLSPKKVESLAEFMQFFGTGFPEKYYLTAVGATTPAAADAKPADNAPANDQQQGSTADQPWGKITLGKTAYNLREVGKFSFNLFNSIRLFYANGGGTCYVVSCGGFTNNGQPRPISAGDLIKGIQVSASFIGPTMLLVPDAALFSLQEDSGGRASFNNVAAAMLQACAKTGDRMAILDVYGADQLDPSDPWDDTIQDFRDGLMSQPREIWKYGAAYFPPLITSVVSADEIDISNFDLRDNGGAALNANGQFLVAALNKLIEEAYPPEAPPQPPQAPGAKTTDGAKDTKTPAPSGGADGGGGAPNASPKGQAIYTNFISKIGTSVAELAPLNLLPAGDTDPANVPARPMTHKQLTSALVATVPGFQKLLAAVAATQGVLPASAAMAGIWTMNDTLSGVWNAPANTGITTLIAPKLPINDHQQEDLNVPTQGLAINAIRTFQGRGNLVWGARTLDSLSNDWRYIQVRRTMIFIEQSVKQALESMVFKPNTEQTWVTVTSMIESFLHNVWAAGGLMGSSPQQAYRVTAGLGSTMTPDDVLNGVMRVQIVLQMVHPAEFIELTFKQQMLGGA